MYPHRPDLLSLAFGVVFLVLGILAMANPSGIPGLDVGVVVGALGLAAGVGIVGSLATGDVHARAARRAELRHRAAPGAGAAATAAAVAEPAAAPVDDLFGPPIDPDELDRVYRETFGDDDRAAAGPAAGSAGEGAAEGSPG